MRPTCAATRVDGRSYEAAALRDGRCLWHTPELAAERAQANRRGGTNRATAARALKHPPPVLADIPERLQGWLTAVETGDLTPQQATAMGGLVARLLDLAKFSLEAQQSAEIEERLRRLEASSGGYLESR